MTREELMRELLRSNMELFNSGLADEEQRELAEAFKKVDTSGDGRISAAELHMALGGDEEGVSKEVSAKLFCFLDADGSGFLDFWEFLTYHYMLKSGLTSICDGCSFPVPILAFSCSECWLRRSPETFDLCPNCFSPNSAALSRHPHPRSAFVHHSALLDVSRAAASSSSGRKHR